MQILMSLKPHKIVVNRMARKLEKDIEGTTV
jgi:hypothetical protein